MESLLITIMVKSIRAGAGAVKRNSARHPPETAGAATPVAPRGRIPRFTPRGHTRPRGAASGERQYISLEVVYAVLDVCGTRPDETGGRGGGVDHRPQPRCAGPLRGPRRVASGGAGMGPAPAGDDGLP